MNTLFAAERSRTYRIVGLAAVLTAAVAVAAMFVANAANRPQPTAGVAIAATTSPGASAAPASSPVPSAAAAPASTAKGLTFVCGSSMAFTGKQPPLSAFIDAVRTGAHTGYDRLTIELQNGQPGSIKLQPQAGTAFTRDGIGDTVKLAGKDGLLITMFSADAHTAYSGSTDLKTGSTGLLEVRKVGDYEGYVHWALGLSGPACYRAVVLANPTRLVIDIQTS